MICLNRCPSLSCRCPVVCLHIADDMLGLGRLFADDTSIGHTAHDENTLKNMINIDLKYIQKWSKRWRVKLNPSKTDIMVFSANNQQNDLT